LNEKPADDADEALLKELEARDRNILEAIGLAMQVDADGAPPT
jgi:hypothetical protein